MWLDGRGECASRKIHGLLGLAASGFVLFALAGCGKPSISPKAAREAAEAEFQRISKEAASIQRQLTPEVGPQAGELLAEGRELAAAGQFDPAIDVLSQVVTLGRQGEATLAEVVEAEALLGEAYFRTGQLYSAERSLRAVTESTGLEAKSFSGRAAARLVDVAIASGEAEHLPELLELTERLAREDRSPAVAYARGKALFALGRFAEAATQASSVQGDRLLARRAAYLRGTALMKQAQSRGRPLDYSAAIAEFERLAKEPTTEGAFEEEEIRDLARLAVARLHYETGFLMKAASAYGTLTEASPHYATALFELGWTYVRMGDYRRAEISLERLAERSPGLIDGAEAALLRADLMLRSGRFREAESVYEKTRDLYAPIIQRLETFIATHPEPAVYYDKLIASDIEAGGDLPRLVVDWAREIAEEQRSFALVDEVARSRYLLERAERTTSLSLSALSSGARIRAFPQAKETYESVVRLQNGTARSQRTLAEGLDAAAGPASGELAQVRQRRRELMKAISELPMTETELRVREIKDKKEWEDALASLQQAELSANQLQALENGLRRVLSDASRGLVNLSATNHQTYGAELARTERELVEYRSEIEQLRRQIELGRQQVGLGAKQTERDAELRREFASLIERELRLSANGQDRKSSARNYSKKALPLVLDMKPVVSELDRVESGLRTEVLTLGNALAEQIAAEAAALPEYSQRLDEFDQAARALVGEVARQSFLEVRSRLLDVILRADLGLVQKSWEVREEQMRRVRRLQRERAREQRRIDEEMAEVLDEPEALR